MNRQANLWRDTAPSAFYAPPLDGDVSTDVVVIGAGFTGCSAALHLAEAGVSVRLIEAETIGHGGSGRNVGLVNAGLWVPPDSVEATLGAEIGRRLNNALASGPAEVFAIVERLSIEAEAKRNGTLHCAHNASGLRDLERRAAQQLKRQAPVELLDAAETARRTGSTRFHGALLDRRAGTIQPLAYVRGLARAASAAGVHIHEKTSALDFNHDGTQWKVRTPGGQISAKHLIQATNAYECRTNQPDTYTPVYFFQFATEPLTRELGDNILPGGEGCWDTDTVMSSFRMDADGRLIIGAIGNLESFGGSIHESWAQRKLPHLFPKLTSVPFQHAWHGRIAMTSDHLPQVSDIGPNAISIHGYSGRGIGPGTVFGKAAAEWVTSNNPDAFPLPIDPLVKERFPRLKRLYYELGASLVHFAKARQLGTADH